jgi:hypothetical protein
MGGLRPHRVSMVGRQHWQVNASQPGSQRKISLVQWQLGLSANSPVTSITFRKLPHSEIFASSGLFCATAIDRLLAIQGMDSCLGFAVPLHQIRELIIEELQRFLIRFGFRR